MRLLTLALMFSFQGTAFAVTADQSVGATVKNLLAIAQIGNASQRVSELCQLVNTTVDLPTISSELLGSTFSTLARDSAGVKNFNALMPSIIVSDFYNLVASKAGQVLTVDPVLVPKGSQRVGVKITLGGTPLTITVNKSTLLILDAEFSSISLVKTQTDSYQRALQGFWNTDTANSLPVTELVNQLVNSGSLIRCP